MTKEESALRQIATMIGSPETIGRPGGESLPPLNLDLLIRSVASMCNRLESAELAVQDYQAEAAERERRLCDLKSEEFSVAINTSLATHWSERHYADWTGPKRYAFLSILLHQLASLLCSHGYDLRVYRRDVTQAEWEKRTGSL